jgi:hypothetical protein
VIPSIDVLRLTVVLGAFVVVGTAFAAGFGWRAQTRMAGEVRMSRAEKEQWRMPALALLQRPPWSPVRRIAMIALSSYLVVAILMLVVRAIQIAVSRPPPLP